MTVDVRTDQDPIRSPSRHVGNEHVRERGMIIGVNRHAGGCKRAVWRTAERLHGFGTDPECRDAWTSVASARARYRPDVGVGMRDQKSDCARLLCPSQLDTAVHMLRRELIFVADQDDPARNTMRFPL